jgi:N-acetylmuramoyl-L-alanine amidase
VYVRRRMVTAAVVLATLAIVVHYVIRSAGHAAGSQGGGASGVGGAMPLDASRFATGSCVAFAPTGGTRHLTVFLDAGHGGPDPGAVGVTQSGAAIAERELTLPTVLDAVPLLQAAGYRVVVSRTTNSSVAKLGPGDLNGQLLTAQGLFADTATRAACANLAGAAVLISLHFNAGSSASNAGMLTAYDDARSFGAQSLTLATLLQRDVLGALNAQGYGVPDDGVVTDDAVGAPALSATAQAYGHLLILGPADPGYFSTPSTMPGALIEPLFLTDPFEGSIADSRQGQQAIAGGILKAVNAFFGGASPSPTATR